MRFMGSTIVFKELMFIICFKFKELSKDKECADFQMWERNEVNKSPFLSDKTNYREKTENQKLWLMRNTTQEWY